MVKLHTKWRPYAALFAILAAVFVAAGIGGSSAKADSQITVCASGCDYTTISDAVGAASSGDTIDVTGDYALSSTVNVSQPITIQGESGATITADGLSSAFSVTAGATIEGFSFSASDGTTNNGFISLLPGANGSTITDNHFTGGYSLGDSEVTRGLVVSPGVTGLTITDNQFEGIRQPAYLDNGDTGTISGNYAAGTKGWVVGAQSSLSFSGNTWGSGSDRNAVDIAIITNASSSDSYSDILALSQANNDAVVDNQYEHTMTSVYVDASASGGGNGYWNSPFQAVQDGVNAVVATGTVNVAAGTYAGQVKINKDLNLQGAGSSSTTLQAAASMASFTINGSAHSPVVAVDGAKVAIGGLTIDGDGQGNSNNRFNGIGGSNADLTIDDVSVVHVRNNPLDGVQGGVGIYDYNVDGTSRTVKIVNSTITDYQKGGVVLSGSGLTADVENVTVTGAGQTSVTAQNGIQVSYGASGTVKDNTVSGNYCTLANSNDNCTADPAGSDPNADGATGILLYQAGSVTVSGNTVNNNQFGIWSVGSTSLTISDNQVSSSGSTSSGVAVWNQDQWSSSATATSGTITGNTLSGMGYGLLVRDYNGSNAPTMTAHNNQVTGNTVPASSNTSFDATNNWWGSASGPGTIAHVTTEPFCVNSTCTTPPPASNGGGGNTNTGGNSGGGGGGTPPTSTTGTTTTGTSTTTVTPTSVAVTQTGTNQPATTPVIQPSQTGTASVTVASTTGGTNASPPVVVNTTWPSGTFTVPVTVSVTPQPGLSAPTAGNPNPPAVAGGLAVGNTVIQIVATNSSNQKVTTLAKPLQVHIASAPGNYVPAFSENGTTWTTIPRIFVLPLAAGQSDGYYVNTDGSIDVYTRHLTYFGLLKDVQAPTKVTLQVRASGNKLRLLLKGAKDNVHVDHYVVLLNGRTVKSTKHGYLVLPARVGRLQVITYDAAGNHSQASSPVTVVRTHSKKHPFAVKG